jgi:hypothetical protein
MTGHGIGANERGLSELMIVESQSNKMHGFGLTASDYLNRMPHNLGTYWSLLAGRPGSGFTGAV